MTTQAKVITRGPRTKSIAQLERYTNYQIEKMQNQEPVNTKVLEDVGNNLRSLSDRLDQAIKRYRTGETGEIKNKEDEKRELKKQVNEILDRIEKRKVS